MDPLWIWIARAAIAVLLAHAALAKLSDRALFEQHLAAYRVPLAWTPGAGWLLPLAELAAAALLLSPLRNLGALLAAAVLSLYALAMAWACIQGRELDCGCGGEPLPVSWWLVARNALLIALAGLAGAPMTDRALAHQDFLLLLPSVLLATMLYAALNQVLRHSAALRPRTGGSTPWRN